MAIKKGSTNINKAYLGGTEIKKMYLGNDIVFDNSFVAIPFIIEVNTSNSGTSNNNQFQFTGAEGDYDVVAKQGGSVVATFNDLSGQETITLPSSGTYVLEVSPKASNGFNTIRFASTNDRKKLTEIKQWGNVVWGSFNKSFENCSNMLVTATDVPILTSVTNMAAMFSATPSDPDVSLWDMSNITNINSMFQNTPANPDVSNWDVSNITKMSSVFGNAFSANPDVSNWDVSSANDMRSMFSGASSANPDVSNWDVSSAGSMGGMFQYASSANPDVSNWDVSNVTNIESMFQNTDLANPDVSLWDTGNVTISRNMFQNTLSANPDVSNWNASSIIQAGSMFNNAAIANPNCSNWNVISLVQAGRMFNDSALSIENLTLIYENWSQLTLQDTGFVEFGAAGIQYNSSGQAGRDIITNTYNWTITDGGVVPPPSRPFILEINTQNPGRSSFNQFEFTGAEGDYDVVAKQNGSVVATYNNLSGYVEITLPGFGAFVLELTPKPTNGFNRIAFAGAGDARKVEDIKQWGTVEWSSFEEGFNDSINLIVTANDVPNLTSVTNMKNMFKSNSDLIGDFSNWDVSNVTTMEGLFSAARKFNSDISSWDVSQVTNMGDMFRNANDFNQDLSSWCVSQIPSKPSNFDGGAFDWTLPRPNWGAAC
jgi:surface protein